MIITRRNFLKYSGATTLAITLGSAFTWHGTQVAYAADAAFAHVLNRTTWGFRPQDLKTIKALGIEGFIEQQLNPESIADPVVDAFMARQEYMNLDIKTLSELGADPLKYYYMDIELVWARIFRAAYSERSLHELMVEFWSDHFNVPVGDSVTAKIVYDRDAIRAHALGNFRELLFATARSAAMMYYLSNYLSYAAHPNENYARELMELHTIGVNGGYTETDVKEVARAFTGWTVDYGTHYDYYFEPSAHDYEEKIVLGHTLAAGRGVEDGEEVLNILASHPATANFVCRKLVRRFVSDDPPASLVASAANVFIATDGDIRAVMRHILTSSEFMASQGQKFRRPLDVLVAMLRVTQPKFDDTLFPRYWLDLMGHVPYYWGPPNGYPEPKRAWLNTNGMLHRWNTALSVAGGAVKNYEGVHYNINKVMPVKGSADVMVKKLIEQVLGGTIDEQDKQQLVALLRKPKKKVQRALVLGLLMASPYFQWR